LTTWLFTGNGNFLQRLAALLALLDRMNERVIGSFGSFQSRPGMPFLTARTFSAWLLQTFDGALQLLKIIKQAKDDRIYLHQKRDQND